MMKVRTNQLSSCEGSREKDLHMVQKKRNKTDSTPQRDQVKGGRHLFSNLRVSVPSFLHLANLSSGRAKSYFVSKVKNFLLGDPN